MTNDISNLSDTVAPESDRLNGDDLLHGEKLITITGVVRYLDPKRNPAFYLNYEGDSGRPFKPCKTQRRIITQLWGEDGNLYIGRQLRLYNEMTVVYAGKETGGLRINGMTDIQGTATIKVSEARGKKKTYTVEKLEKQQKPPYPTEKFNSALGAMEEKIKSGKLTPEQVITKCEQTGTLTDEQRETIRSFGEAEEPAPQNAAEDFLDD